MATKEETAIDFNFDQLLASGGNPVEPPKKDENDGGDKNTNPDQIDDDLDLENILKGEATDDSSDNEDDEGKTGDEDAEDKGNKPPASDDTDSSDEPFALVFAKHLKEQGLVSSFDEEEFKKLLEDEGPDGALETMFLSEIENVKKDVSADLDEYSKEYAQLREMGYSAEEAGNFIGSVEEIENLKEEDLEKEDSADVRKKILSQHYKATTTFSDEKIKKLVQRSIDLGDDVDDAKEALTGLKELSKKQLEDLKQQQADQEQQAKDNYKKYVQSLDKTLKDIKEIIPGQEISPRTRNKIKDMITKPVKQDEQGNVLNGIWSKRSEDSINFDTKLAYLIDIGVFDGNWDKINKIATTKVSSKIKDYIDNQDSKAGFKGSGKTPSPSSKDKDVLGPLKNLI